MKTYTTLNLIWKRGPCSGGWSTLMRGLGKTKPDNRRLPLSTILRINGLSDAMWATRTIDGHEGPMRLFACDCIEDAFSKDREIDEAKPYLKAVRMVAMESVLTHEIDGWVELQNRARRNLMLLRADSNHRVKSLNRALLSLMWHSRSTLPWLHAASVLDECLAASRFDRLFTKSHAEALFVKRFCTK